MLLALHLINIKVHGYKVNGSITKLQVKKIISVNILAFFTIFQFVCKLWGCKILQFTNAYI